MSKEQENLIWAEPLPTACPPAEAFVPNGQDSFFRLVDTFPPTERDFCSQKMLNPNRVFKNGECIARAVSLFTSYSHCVNNRKLPALRQKIVVELVLSPDSGLILKTGGGSHFSWWRTRDFNPIPSCSKIKE